MSNVRGVPSSNVPEPTLRRLPWYLAYAQLVQQGGGQYLSSTQIAHNIAVDPSMVAKDLSYVNIAGRTRVGYEVNELVRVLERFLGFTQPHKAFLFGVGRLGGALLHDNGLQQFGLEIVAGFDVKRELDGTNINRIPVYHISRFPELREPAGVDIGILTVPVGVFLALLVAVLLNAKLRGRTAFRAIFFLPMVVAPAAVAMVWKWLFNTEYGIINSLLGQNIRWLTNPNIVLAACAIVAIWSSIGYDAVLLLSGIQNISPSLYEAAGLDGASKVTQFFHITLPMVSPTLFVVLIMRLMASLKVYDLIYMMVEQSNPALPSAQSLMYLFYRESFVAGNKGYASAIVIWTVLLIGIVTAVQFMGQKKWVNYEV